MGSPQTHFSVQGRHFCHSPLAVQKVTTPLLTSCTLFLNCGQFVFCGVSFCVLFGCKYLRSQLTAQLILLLCLMSVIDFCLTKTMLCDPITNYPSLQLQWAAKGNCEQRKGTTSINTLLRLLFITSVNTLSAFICAKAVRTCGAEIK